MESKQKLAGKYKENVKNLGVLCAVMENDYPRAARLIEDMRDMVRKKPKNKHLRQKLANAVLVLDARTGEQKVAKEYYEKLLQKEPEIFLKKYGANIIYLQLMSLNKMRTK